MSSPGTVAVLGAGSWGTALALLIARGGTPVHLWAHRAAHCADLERDRENTRYLPGARFPDNLDVTASLDDVTVARDVLAVIPTHAFADTLGELGSAFDRANVPREDVTVTWGTKGLEPKSGDQLDAVVDRVLPGLKCRAIVSGPTFAREVADDLPAAMTIAGSNVPEVQRLAEVFRSERMRIYPNDDFVGVQTAGAVKNVMAIATGICDGLGLGANARAALITRGLAELTRLGVRLGGQPQTFMGLAGVGDLVLTCTDDQSRNRRFGLGLGRGGEPDAVREAIGQAVEGINTCRELYQLSDRLDVPMPVSREVYRVVFDGIDPKQAVVELMGREPRTEAVPGLG